MTGVSRVTLARIKNEASVNNAVWRTPGKGRGSKTGHPLKINLDDFDEFNSISNCIDSALFCLCKSKLINICTWYVHYALKCFFIC
ncbi:unnamed protein product [Colias eurytheme]|nr:unnamed protein product [Colias eurytheme]